MLLLCLFEPLVTASKRKETGSAPCGRGRQCCSSAARNQVPSRNVTGSEIAVNESGELRFRQGADFLRFDGAALEQKQGRDAADAEFTGNLGVVVDVQLGDAQLAGIVLDGSAS